MEKEPVLFNFYGRKHMTYSGHILLCTINDIRADIPKIT